MPPDADVRRELLDERFIDTANGSLDLDRAVAKTESMSRASSLKSPKAHGSRPCMTARPSSPPTRLLSTMSAPSSSAHWTTHRARLQGSGIDIAGWNDGDPNSFGTWGSCGRSLIGSQHPNRPIGKARLVIWQDRRWHHATSHEETSAERP